MSERKKKRRAWMMATPSPLPPHLSTDELLRFVASARFPRLLLHDIWLIVTTYLGLPSAPHAIFMDALRAELVHLHSWHLRQLESSFKCVSVSLLHPLMTASSIAGWVTVGENSIFIGGYASKRRQPFPSIHPSLSPSSFKSFEHDMDVAVGDVRWMAAGAAEASPRWRKLWRCSPITGGLSFRPSEIGTVDGLGVSITPSSGRSEEPLYAVFA
jgi:hypothetical protein